MAAERGSETAGFENESPSPRAGTIWSVPAVNGRCLLMSRPHQRDGISYYFALPLYPDQDSVTAHGELDFLFNPGETSLGESVYGAFWNSRFIPASALGEHVGEVTSDPLLVELYLLRAKLEKEEPRHGRFGRRIALNGGISSARSREVARWTALARGNHETSRESREALEQRS